VRFGFIRELLEHAERRHAAPGEEVPPADPIAPGGAAVPQSCSMD
jgi:hypothetical protein